MVELLDRQRSIRDESFRALEGSLETCLYENRNGRSE
jgi:hypothetical protein